MVEKQQLIEEVSNMLKKLGISPDKNGYGYLRTGIIECYNNPELLHKITKGLYPTIGKAFNKSELCVERSIRSAIETGWIRSDYEYSNKLFLGVVDYEKSRPTNSEFISVIVDYLLIKYSNYNI